MWETTNQFKYETTQPTVTQRSIPTPKPQPPEAPAELQLVKAPANSSLKEVGQYPKHDDGNIQKKKHGKSPCEKPILDQIKNNWSPATGSSELSMTLDPMGIIGGGMFTLRQSN